MSDLHNRDQSGIKCVVFFFFFFLGREVSKVSGQHKESPWSHREQLDLERQKYGTLKLLGHFPQKNISSWLIIEVCFSEKGGQRVNLKSVEKEVKISYFSLSRSLKRKEDVQQKLVHTRTRFALASCNQLCIQKLELLALQTWTTLSNLNTGEVEWLQYSGLAYYSKFLR